LLPPLAALAGTVVTEFVRRCRVATVRVAVMVLLLLSVGATAVDMVKLHPHQYVYFNRLFGGGVAEAAKSFDTDYWGNSYKEGVEWVVKNYRGGGDTGKIKVASCLHSLSTSYFLPQDRFEYVGSVHSGRRISAEPDLFLATPRWNCDKTFSGRVIHTVARQGAPLLYVIEVGARVEAGKGNDGDD
jgi:hypothetical protein